MRTARSVGPPWMPAAGTISVLPAGRWWDAIVVPQQRGLDVLEVLDHETGHTPGPVVWDQNLANPRLYFLVPVGTAADWAVPDTIALSAGTYVGIPGGTTLEPPGAHWLCPPDPDEPEALVDAGRLLAAFQRFGEAA